MQRYAHSKGSAFAFLALDRYGSVVTQDRAPGDRQSEACSSDLAGAGLIHAEESLKNTSLVFLRDPDSVVCDAQHEILFVRINRDGHFPVFPVIFNGILDQIGEDQADSGGIHLGVHLTAVDQSHGDIGDFRDGAHALHDSLRQCVDVGLCDFEVNVGPVFFDQGQKIGNDLVLTVDLAVDILEKFSVDGRIHILFRQKRCRKDFHGCHRGLELMRHVRDEFLPRLVQGVHPGQNCVEGIRNVHGLQIAGRRDRFIGIPFFDFKDVPGQDLKGTYQHSGNNDRSQENNDQHDCLQHKCLAPQNILGLLDVFRGSTCQQYTQDCV